MADLTIRRRSEIPYLLEARHAEAAWKIISDLGWESKNIEIVCSDGATITTEDIDDLLKFPNVSERKIIEISFGTNNRIKEYSKLAFTFGPNGIFTLTASGASNSVHVIDRSVNELLSSCKAMRFRVNWMAEAIIIGILTFLSSVYIGNLFEKIDKPPSKIEGGVFLLIFSIFLWIVLSVLFFFINSACRHLWPPSAFLIGDGLPRYQVIKNIRSTIIISVFLSVIVGTFVNLISSKIF